MNSFHFSLRGRFAFKNKPESSKTKKNNAIERNFHYVSNIILCSTSKDESFVLEEFPKEDESSG